MDALNLSAAAAAESFSVVHLNSSWSSADAGYSLAAVAGIAALVSFLILFTVVGNVLVVIAVLTSRALKAPQNLFLVSLATADILVATLVMPFSLANELMGYWYFGKVWCGIYLALDVLFCTSSIVHLCAISLDRYWSVTQAVEYNLKRTPKRVKCTILIVWLISACISSPPLVSIDDGDGGGREAPAGSRPQPRPKCQLNDDTWYILSSSVASFFAPCVIMVLVYVRIYQVAKTRTRSMSVKKPRAEGTTQQTENGGLSKSPPPPPLSFHGEHENGHCHQCSPSTPLPPPSSSPPPPPPPPPPLPPPSANHQHAAALQTQTHTQCQAQTQTDEVELDESSEEEEATGGKGLHKKQLHKPSGGGGDGDKNAGATGTTASHKSSSLSLKHPISRAGNKSMEIFASKRVQGGREGRGRRRGGQRRRSSTSGKKAYQAREKRFTFVLAVVMGVFVVCWFPFFFSYSLYAVCREACRIPDPLFKFFFWIGYCNSSLNPAIYTIFNQDFRQAFQKILYRSWKKSF